jgi:DNA-binding transcriptional MerR regulator
MGDRYWKVGELAQLTGLTIRTLHHYDEIGLLAPSHHSGSGHRLYTAADIARLQQIKSLRQLGFSLAQVRDCLGRAEFDPLEVIQLHLARLREQMALQASLCQRLERIANRLRSAEEVSAEEFLRTIEVMAMFEQYYTPEQLEQLRQRKEMVGEERIRQVEQEWREIFAQLRTLMDQGTPPSSPPALEIARRCQGLIQEFTGGDPGVEKSLNALYRDNPTAMNQFGYDVDQSLSEYMGQIMAALADQGGKS